MKLDLTFIIVITILLFAEIGFGAETPPEVGLTDVLKIWEEGELQINDNNRDAILGTLKTDLNDLLKTKQSDSDKALTNSMIQSINDIQTNLVNSNLKSNIEFQYADALANDNFVQQAAISRITSIFGNDELKIELDKAWVMQYGDMSSAEFGNLPAADRNAIMAKYNTLSPDLKKQNTNFQNYQEVMNEMSREAAGTRALSLAAVGSFIAEQFGIERFTFMDDLFDSQFGRFISGEPSFGICESKIRSSGNSLGIIMDDSLDGRIIAHIEGEKSKLEYPDGKVEYFYRITLQVNAKAAKEGETAPEIRYNIDLTSSGAAAGSVFKEDQKSKSSVSLVGTSAIVKYSSKDYTTLCLRSSSGNTCNMFVDVSQLATVEGDSVTPGGYSGTYGFSGGGSTTADPYNEW
ncbi:MAG: hypothetical protein WC471_05330 [Candidatus Woesearchaeota archaeon]